MMISELRIQTEEKNIFGMLYRPEGEGKHPTVILSHGYNCSYMDMQRECGYFAENGYVAYAFDFCGGSVRSKSSGATRDMTLFTETDDLREVFNYIRGLDFVDESRIFLLGQSQGGFIEAILSEELGDAVRGMIMYYPGFCIPYDWQSKYPTYENVPESFSFWGMTLGANFVLSMKGFDVKKSFGAYNGPVQIIYGAKDPIVSKEYVDMAASFYKDPEVIVYPEEQHGFSDKASIESMEHCLEFMNKH